MINSPEEFSNFEAAKVSIQKNWNYEETVAKIEKIVTEIESGKLQLAEVFDEFAVAVEYLCQCENFLQEKHQQVDLSIETLVDDGDSF